MSHTDPTGFCADVVSTYICRFVATSILNFLFGRGGDAPPPPPDHCKDDTVGCGGTSASKLFENISLDFFVLPLDDDASEDEGEEEILENGVFQTPKEKSFSEKLNELLRQLNEAVTKRKGCPERPEIKLCIDFATLVVPICNT